LSKPSPKLIPWFVSDVTPKDFAETLDVLFHKMDKDFFTGVKIEEDKQNTKKLAHLDGIVNRWKQHITSGVFALSVPHDTPLGGHRGQGTPSPSVRGAEFWTSPWPYWDMQTLAPELWNDLSANSGLVILKVYRTSDILS
jgi:damage-control phosphatase, subfamily III